MLVNRSETLVLILELSLGLFLIYLVSLAELHPRGLCQVEGLLKLSSHRSFWTQILPRGAHIIHLAEHYNNKRDLIYF